MCVYTCHRHRFHFLFSFFKAVCLIEKKILSVSSFSCPNSPFLSSPSKQVPHQMGALTFYRYEQPIVDYCQAHQPLRLNMGYEGPPQCLEGLEDLRPCERATIQTVALPAVPAAAAATIGPSIPGPRSPPPALRPTTEAPSGGLPTERTGTLKFGR